MFAILFFDACFIGHLITDFQRRMEVIKHIDELIERVKEKMAEDHSNGIDPRIRGDKFLEVIDILYYKAIPRFWKPIESFYDRKALLK